MCDDCVGVFEVFAPMSDSAKQQECPECKKLARKIFTTAKLKTDKHYSSLRGTSLFDAGKCNWLRAERDGSLQQKLEEPYTRDGVRHKDFSNVIERNKG